jgi:plastocyanin
MKKVGFTFLGAALVLAVGLTFYFQQAAANEHAHKHAKPARAAETDAGSRSGIQTETVSFGGWITDPPLDRFPNNNPIAAVYHELTPATVTIKAGGTVRFIIGGFHNVVVYDDGTQPGDIDTTITVPPTNGGPPLIADPENRIYRGLDPSLFPQDRVEVVQFEEPGTYLVICAVLPHFQDGMFGYVRVLGPIEDEGSNADK